MPHNDLRMQRIAEEVLLLAWHFGEIEYDDQHGRWVMLPRFPLPPRIGRPDCALLIKLPLEYPAVPPHGVFVDRDLPLDQHYFPAGSRFNPHSREGWAWLCLHAKEDDPSAWQPAARAADGDNLLVLLALVRALLDREMRAGAGEATWA
jgi:hypothetical protein